MDKKRILILGAGVHQLDIIKTAVNAGCHVITLDYLPDNIGHKYSHQFVNCSTVDIDGVLKHAKDLQIDGICTACSDIALPTVAHVGTELGLKVVPPSVAETVTYKESFRDFQKSSNLSHPGFVWGSSFDELIAGLEKLTYPIVFKPTDRSGSRGVCMIREFSVDECRNAFDDAKKFSRRGIVIAEEYVKGIDVSGDAFLRDGKILFCGITRKMLRNFVPTGHMLPTDISEAEQSLLKQELQKTCTMINYLDGPLDIDAKILPGKVVIIEMAVRCGGNGIVPLMRRGFGADLSLATIQHSLGEKADIPHRDVPNGSASMMIIPEKSGTFYDTIDEKELKKIVPEVFQLLISVKSGEEIPPFQHSGNIIGLALFDCQKYEDYSILSKKIYSSLKINIR
ncbi:MAG: ATP-grasp domain-containing protein [Candidatus Riflebacteria bacterium]|nr:ATP-grasp domain-containing protein [Candidatus Riflebacteria bacterium]